MEYIQQYNVSDNLFFYFTNITAIYYKLYRNIIQNHKNHSIMAYLYGVNKYFLLIAIVIDQFSLKL